MTRWGLLALALAACGQASQAAPPRAAASQEAMPVTGAQTQPAPVNGPAKERAWDLAGAEQDYAAQDGKDLDAQISLARVQMLQGKIEQAEKTLLTARVNLGDKAELLNALSTVARMQKRHGAAIDFAKRVLLRDAQNTQAHVNIAMAQMEQGKLDVAEQYLQTVLARIPKAAPLHVTLGLIHVKRQQAGQAMALFKKALEQEPNNAAARVNAGFLALAYRDYSAAKTHLDAAVSLGAVTKEVIAGRCYALEGMRQGEPAAACFGDLVARQGLSDNDRASYYYALGGVHQTLTRKPKAALDAYRRYVELKGAGLTKTDKVWGVMKKLEASEEPAGKPGSQAQAVGAGGQG